MSVEWFWGGEGNSIREFNSNSGAAIASAQTGMSGSYCLNVTGSTAYANKTVTARAAYYLGLRYVVTTLSSSRRGIALFREGATRHVGLAVNADGTISLYRGTVATILATGTYILTTGTAYLINIYANINDSTGSVVVKINGTTDINFSGDTRNAGAVGQIDTITFGYDSTANTVYGSGYFDDIVVKTDDYPGDVRVGGKEVDGVGVNDAWSVTSGTKNAAMADSDDATYCYTNTPNQEQSFTLANVTEAINAVQAFKVVAAARYQGAPAVTKLDLGFKTSGAMQYSADKTLPAAFGVNLYNIWETDPTDSAVFTDTKINAMEIGYKAIA